MKCHLLRFLPTRLYEITTRRFLVQPFNASSERGFWWDPEQPFNRGDSTREPLCVCKSTLPFSHSVFRRQVPAWLCQCLWTWTHNSHELKEVLGITSSLLICDGRFCSLKKGCVSGYCWAEMNIIFFSLWIKWPEWKIPPIPLHWRPLQKEVGCPCSPPPHTSTFTLQSLYGMEEGRIYMKTNAPDLLIFSMFWIETST